MWWVQGKFSCPPLEDFFLILFFFFLMLKNGNQFQAWKLLLFLKFELILWHCAQWFEQWEFQVGPAVGISAGDELWVARYILEVVWMKKIVINKAIIWWSTFFFVIILRLTLVWKSEDHRNCWSSSFIWPKTIQRHFLLVLFVVFTIHSIYMYSSWKKNNDNHLIDIFPL